jgi:hypothetical protein
MSHESNVVEKIQPVVWTIHGIEFEQTLETNDMGYLEVDASKFKPLHDFILVQWDLCQKAIKLGQYVLARPETYMKMHYVGTVIAVGPDVDIEIKPGIRLVFDQFSQFEKFWDEKIGRVALLQESKQGALFAIVPQRVKIEGSEPDFNYDV